MIATVAENRPLDPTVTPCIVPGGLADEETIRTRGLWATLSKHIIAIVAFATLSYIVYRLVDAFMDNDAPLTTAARALSSLLVATAAAT